MKYAGGEQQHGEKPQAAGHHAGDDEPGDVFGNRQGGGKQIEKVARPNILEKRSAHTHHDARAEIPQQHAAQERRHEVVAAAAHGIQIACDEPPQYDIDRNPTHHGSDAHRTAAQQIYLAQHDAGDGPKIHNSAPTSWLKGSRATRMNKSSKLADPCSPGRVLGFPSSSTLPCDKNSTRSHTASTSYMLCEVHKMPQRSRDAKFLIRSRMICAADGSKEAVGSSSKSNCGLLSTAFASAARVCSPDDSNPHLVSRKR